MGRSIGRFIDVAASCTESHTEKMETIDQTQSKVLRVPRRSTRPAALSARIYGNGRSLFFVHLFQLLFIQSLVQDPFNPVKRTCNKTNSVAACLCHQRSFEFARFIRRASFLKRHYLHPRFTFLPFFFPLFPFYEEHRREASPTLRTNEISLHHAVDAWSLDRPISFYLFFTRWNILKFVSLSNDSSRISIFHPLELGRTLIKGKRCRVPCSYRLAKIPAFLSPNCIALQQIGNSAN